jgi:hypothetical protein
MYILFPIQGAYPLHNRTFFSLTSKEKEVNKKKENKKTLQNDLEKNRYGLIPQLN